jgi:hypothetical protein
MKGPRFRIDPLEFRRKLPQEVPKQMIFHRILGFQRNYERDPVHSWRGPLLDCDSGDVKTHVFWKHAFKHVKQICNSGFQHVRTQDQIAPRIPEVS